jgi:PTS system nitrogen regulatory IIA component
MAAGVSTRDIRDYESLDGKPVRLILMIAARPDQHAAYLRLLAQVSSRLKNDSLRGRLLTCRDSVSFYDSLVAPSGGAA